MWGRTYSLILPDGRRLAYAIYGDPGAKETVFYFHGCPGSRLEVELSGESMPLPAVRLVAVDRPGIGGSDRQEKRKLLDWPGDVLALADALEAERFFLLGVSGGGPYAAACAYSMPDRVSSTALVCPLFPLYRTGARKEMAWRHRIIMDVAGHCPPLLAGICGTIGWQIRKMPQTVLFWMTEAASAPDRVVLARPEVREIFIRSFREAIGTSINGIFQDLIIYTRPWGFAVGQIPGRVDLWQGCADHTVPAEMGRRWVRELARCRPHFLPGQGHFSLPINHLAEVIRNLIDSRAV